MTTSSPSGSAEAIAEHLATQVAAIAADCLNIRVHAPGMAPAEARSHIAALVEVRTLLARDWIATPPGD